MLSTLFFPIVLLTYAVIVGDKGALAFGLIWSAHIGFDRLLGYGLKMENGFSETHLGKIGKKTH